MGKAFVLPPGAPTFAEKTFQCRWAEGGSPAAVSGAGSVTLLPRVGANLLSSLAAAPLAESRCHPQIPSAVESQL